MIVQTYLQLILKKKKKLVRSTHLRNYILEYTLTAGKNTEDYAYTRERSRINAQCRPGLKVLPPDEFLRSRYMKF